MKYNPIPKEYVEIIKNFLETKEDTIKLSCVNKIIKENIFDILDNNCTVVYYPINDENNGFHTARYVHGEKRNFVFINTWNPMEKQIFTAAHELGHIWELDKQFKDCKCDVEDIMNRFAAELLMPEELFTKDFNRLVDNYLQQDKILFTDFIKVCIDLMDIYFVPIHSVVIRIFEIEKIDKKSLDNFLGLLENEILSQDELKKFAKAASIKKLFNPMEDEGKRGINNLDELLNKMAKIDGFQDYVKNLRNKFDIPEPKDISEAPIEIGNLEG